ncbi:hypothetical protein O162_20070 [Pseudomonas putida SJ3]|nr:hypothetical protein O162_20070 [Pseudomonas putida SJ3]
MTAIHTIPVTTCSVATEDVCSIYLVGGFDEEKTHYPGCPEFRRDLKKPFERWAKKAEKGDRVCQEIIKLIVVDRLSSGTMRYRGRDYRFCVDEFQSETLDFLATEVLAQVNEW